MLGLSVMQVGIFAAIPLVADREKLILKRLAATPLRRWQLVGSNVLMRLLIALVQAVIIVGVGVALFGVEIVGSLLLAGAFIALGAMAFLAGLRDRDVREDRGGGERDDERRPVPDDVPIGHVLSDRADARFPADDRPTHPVDVPR
jgi:ABC-2 family transporter protein